MFLDLSRSALQLDIAQGNASSSVSAADYVKLVRAMSSMLGFACTGTENSWLVDIARSLPWSHWTPSYALMRERSLLSMVQAASVTTAFGGEIAERYIERLSLIHDPLGIADCALGLVSIASLDQRFVDPSLRALKSKLDSAQADSSSVGRLYRAIWRTADAVLERPRFAESVLSAWTRNVTNNPEVESGERLENVALEVMHGNLDGVCLTGEMVPAQLLIPIFNRRGPEGFFLPSDWSPRRAKDWNLGSNEEALGRSASEVVFYEETFH